MHFRVAVQPGPDHSTPNLKHGRCDGNFGGKPCELLKDLKGRRLEFIIGRQCGFVLIPKMKACSGLCRCRPCDEKFLVILNGILMTFDVSSSATETTESSTEDSLSIISTSEQTSSTTSEITRSRGSAECVTTVPVHNSLLHKIILPIQFMLC